MVPDLIPSTDFQERRMILLSFNACTDFKATVSYFIMVVPRHWLLF